MLTYSATIFFVSPRYADTCVVMYRHAIVVASACCHGCMRIYAYAYAQTTVSNMNVSSLELSC